MPEHIGFVLARVPGYSETFMLSKINILQKSGFKITVFTSVPNYEKTTFAFKNPFPGNTAIKLILFIPVIFWVLFRKPVVFYRYIKLSLHENRRLLQSFSDVYSNAHILLQNLSHIHFGFATLALTREHIAKSMNAKMSCSFRGYDINIYPVKNPGCYNKLWKYCDKIHSISEGLVKNAREAGLPDSITPDIIYPAVSIENFPMKSNLGPLHTPVNILTTGRLTWVKGHENHIRAAAIIKQRFSEFKWNIIGDGEDLEYLTQLIHLYKLQEHVFLTGKLSHADIANQLSEADIYVQYSFHEGFCNAVLEAQSTGTVCVVSNVDGLPENVVDQKTGFVVNPDNPELLAESILNVIYMNDKDRKIMGELASKRVQNLFDLEIQSAKFNRFFND